MSNFEIVRPGFWDTPIGTTRADANAVANSGSSWALAVLPALYVGFLALIVAGGVTDPLVHALFAALFYLAGVALAAVDEHVLRAAGHEVTASPFLALLGAVPYLSVRTRHMIDATGGGLAVLWVSIATMAGALLVIGAMLVG